MHVVKLYLKKKKEKKRVSFDNLEPDYNIKYAILSKYKIPIIEPGIYHS